MTTMTEPRSGLAGARGSGRRDVACRSGQRGEEPQHHRHALPAFVIFSDKVLVDIAHHHPDTLTALRSISGVGDAKLAHYGMEVLRVLTSVN